MPSKLMRRSGIAAVHISKLVGFAPKTVIQVGVGMYWEEVDCIKEQWPDVYFVGFEPNPVLFKKLDGGKYPGLLYSCAIGDATGEATLYFRKRHKDGSSLYQLYAKEGEETHEVIVPVEKLDDFFHLRTVRTKPVLLWLDCEGSELKALQGGREVIKSVDMVNVEMTGKPPGDGWCKPQDVHDLLIEYGFHLQYVHTFRTASGQYDAVYVRPHLFRSEYCSFPCACSRFVPESVSTSTGNCGHSSTSQSNR